MAVHYENETAYWGRVTRQAMGKTKNGNAQFVVSFLVVGKVDPMDPQGALLSCQQHERSVFRVITDKTIDYALEDLQALCDARGITPYPTSFRQVDPTRGEFSCDFVGAELAFFCRHDTYEGKTNEKWQVSRGGGASAGEAMDDKEMRQLDALFAKKMGGGKPATKAPPRRTKTEAGMAAQAPLNAPADDGPDPWDKDDAKAKEANRKLAEASAESRSADPPF